MPADSDFLMEVTFGEAEKLFQKGWITQDQFLWYCYEWRSSMVRFSDLGRWHAEEWAKMHGLPDADEHAQSIARTRSGLC